MEKSIVMGVGLTLVAQQCLVGCSLSGYMLVIRKLRKCRKLGKYSKLQDVKCTAALNNVKEYRNF